MPRVNLTARCASQWLEWIFPLSNSLLQSRIRDIRQFRPFAEWPIDSSVRKHHGIALVTRLIFKSSPFAVTGLVVPVHVNSFKCHPFGAVAHVFVEGFERIIPSLAHRDASPTITFKMGILWIEASRFGVAPFSIFSRVRSTMSCENFLDTINPKASATTDIFSVHARKVSKSHCNNRFLGAIADAQPERYSLDPPCKRNGRKSSEFLPSNIFEVVSAFGRFVFSHNASSKVLWLGPEWCSNTASACLF